MARKATSKSDSPAILGFGQKLWLAAEPSGARQPARQGSPQGQRGGAEQYNPVALSLKRGAFWRLNPAIPEEARATLRRLRIVQTDRRLDP